MQVHIEVRLQHSNIFLNRFSTLCSGDMNRLADQLDSKIHLTLLISSGIIGTVTVSEVFVLFCFVFCVASGFGFSALFLQRKHFMH